ncbi:MAG: hypothetical protein JWM28_1976 [Chitinophagaceae bacterium]|nr:hypothetical protein [Chitinophagaceae bacterium]
MNMENLTLRSWPKINFVPRRLSPAAWLTVTYLLISVLWILGSDRIAAIISGDDRLLLENIQAAKGLFFVLISSTVLFILSRKFYNDLRASFQQQEAIQAKYNAVNEVSRDGLFDCDLMSRRARINNKMKFFFPFNSNEVDDFWEKYQKRIHPDDSSRLLHEFETLVDSGKSTWLREYQLLGRDNKYYTVISNVYIIRDTVTGDAVRLIGALHDITELRNLQAENYEQRLWHKQQMTDVIIRAQENERDRWAVELHDNVCQVLGVAKMYLSEIGPHNASSEALLPEANKMISLALDEIRQLSYSMKPPSFDKMTLSESIDNLVSNVRRIKPFVFSLNMDHFQEQQVADDRKLLIYRIIQEQLSNIVKYAAAGKVDVTVAIDRSREIHVTIKDNGQGFDPHQVKAGIGLRNIESRIQAHRGILKIQSSPGSGCTLFASFSL